MAKAATKKKNEPISIDDKILAQYLANNPDAKVQELDTGGNVVGDEQTLENFVNDINRSQPASLTPVSDTVTTLQSAANTTASGNGNAKVSGNGGSSNVSSDSASTSDSDSDTSSGESGVPVVTPGALAAPALNTVGAWTRGAGDWISSQPTPGGIAALLVAILFLLWVLVPTSTGQTRMYLLWLTLTGRTQLKDRAGYSLDGMVTAMPVTGAQEIPQGGTTTPSPQSTNGVGNPNLPNNYVDFSV